MDKQLKTLIGKNTKLFLEDIRAKGYGARLVPMAQIRDAVFMITEETGRDIPILVTETLAQLNGIRVWYSFVMSDDRIVHMPVRTMNLHEKSEMMECVNAADYAVIIRGIDCPGLTSILEGLGGQSKGKARKRKKAQVH